LLKFAKRIFTLAGTEAGLHAAASGIQIEIARSHSWPLGSHRKRKLPRVRVTLGEDACRVAPPKAARDMVTLRNLAIGLNNLLQYRGKTKVPSLPSCQRSMTASQALNHVLC